jgi:hypothetical protein
MDSPLGELHLDSMYALVLEAEGFQFLIDPAVLWKPPRLLVRRGSVQTEVWLDETDISFMKASKFSVRDQTLILNLVEEHLDELLCRWALLKDDVRRGRLERNVLVN